MAIKINYSKKPSVKKTKAKTTKFHTVRLTVDFPAEITSEDPKILAKMTNRLLKYVFEESTPEELEKRHIYVDFAAYKGKRRKYEENFLIISSDGDWLSVKEVV